MQVAVAQVSTGTGFAVVSGLLVTNHHVIEGCSSIEVKTENGRHKSVVVDADQQSDLALLRVPTLVGLSAKIRSPAVVNLGEPVMVFGFPLAGALTSSGNFTSGLVSGLRGLGEAEGVFQITAPVQLGNSGGPVLDASGQVIGVVTSKLNAVKTAVATGDIPQNINFAVTPEALNDFLIKNKVPVDYFSSKKSLNTASIAKLAQSFTYQIECMGKSKQANEVPKINPKPSTPTTEKADSPSWVESLDPNAWVMQHGAFDSLSEARQFQSTSNGFKSGQVFFTQRKGSKPYYILVTGPYADEAQTYALMKQNPQLAKAWVRSVRSLKEQLLREGLFDQNRTQDKLVSSVEVFKDCDQCPEMVVIPPGSFMMGSRAGVDANSEQPQHRVNVQKFAIGKFEVTQEQWIEVMRHNPSHYLGNNRPVESVSWEDANNFVTRLAKLTGKNYRLPSESEWEYVASDGNATKTRDTNYLHQHAWTDTEQTKEVGLKMSNNFGVHDIIGNVNEWTSDCWNENYIGAPTDGSAWTSGDCSLRVYRGLDHMYKTKNKFAVTYRLLHRSSFKAMFIGLRVVRDLP